MADMSSGTAGSLTLGGAGTLTLTGSNTYTGVTTVGSGMLQLGDGTSRNGSVAGGIVVNTGSLTFANPAAQTFANSLTGSGNLTKTGGGAMTLSGTGIQCNGNVNVTSGTLASGQRLERRPRRDAQHPIRLFGWGWAFAHGQHPQHRVRGRAGVLRR